MKNINWFDHLLNFVSVIVGVSLAFYIGDRNDRSNQEAEADQIVQALIDELDRDISVYDNYQIANNQDQLNKIGVVLQRLRTENFDSLDVYFQGVLGFRNYSPQSVTFNSIAASGKLELIDNFDLRMQLTTYHNILAKEGQFKGTAQVDFYNTHFVPVLLNGGDLMNPDISSYDLTQVSNLLMLYGEMIREKVNHYGVISKGAKELTAALKDYQSNE